MGGVGNGAAGQDGRWDLTPGAAAIPERGPHGFGGVNHEALTEWGPCGSDTADAAGSMNMDFCFFS